MMQQAIQIQTLVDQAVVDALPELQPLLGHQIQMIALDLEQSRSSDSVQNSPSKQRIASTIPDVQAELAHTQFWQRLLALRDQAIAEGMHLMNWDEINAEVQNRRGGVHDE